LTLSDVERAMPGRFEPPSASAAYLLGLFFAASVVMTLPLIYAAVIAAVAALGVFAAAKGYELVLTPRLSLIFPVVVLCLAAVFACGIIVYYLLRQLFLIKRPFNCADMKELDPANEPLIYALAKNVAERINAPPPDRIYLSILAEASVLRTYKNLFFADKRFLIIGLPYIEGLNARGVAGIIASELARYSQSAGAGVGRALDRVLSMFAQAAYPDESREAGFEKIAGSESDYDPAFKVRTRIFSKIGLFFAVLTARALYKFGLLFSRFFLRKMELDADACSAAVQGSVSFCETEKKRGAMSAAQSFLFLNPASLSGSGGLPDNIPAAVAAIAGEMDEAERKKVENRFKAVKSALRDARPSPGERSEAALKRNSMGIFALEAPASALLSDSYAVGKEITLDFYKRIPALKNETHKLVSTDGLMGRKQKINQELDNLDAFLGATIHFKNWFFPPPLSLVPPDNPKDVLEGWKNARNKMLELQKDAETTASAYDEIVKQRRGALIAYRLITLGMPIKDPRKYGLAEAEEGAAAAALNKFAARKSKTDELMAPYFKAAGARIWCVLTLLSLQAVRDKMPKGNDFYENSRKLMETLLTIKSVYELLLRLDAEAEELSILSGIADPANSNAVKEAKAEKLAAMRSLVSALKSSLSAAKYPFAKDASESDIWDWATRSNRAFSSDETSLLNAAGDLLTNIPRLYSRTMGRLCVISAQVESLFQSARK